MKSPTDKIVSTSVGVMAVCLTAISVILFGALFCVSYKSECSRDDTGKRECTDHLEFSGWAGLPLQPIASAVGIGAGMFVVASKSRSPSEVIEYLIKKNDDVSGSS